MGEVAARSRPWVWCAATLVLAGVILRCIHSAHVAFGGEQVESIALAWKSWRESGTDHGLRVSIGIDMPPFYLWLLSLPVAVTRDPVRVTQFVMFLNVAGLAGLFFLVRARRSASEAWLVTALVATAPWSILFARKIWAQDVLFPFLVAFYAVFLSALDRPAPWKTWLSFLVLGVVMQIYPSAWFLLPAIVATAWIAKLRVRLRDVVIGLFLVLLLWWPYLRYQYAVEFDDWRYLWAMKFGHGTNAPLQVALPEPGGAGGSRGLATQMLGVWQRSGGSGLDDVLGAKAYADWQSQPVARAATLAADVFLVVCAAVTVWAVAILGFGVRARATRAERPASDATLVLCAAILICVPIEYALVHAAPMSHYHIVVQPAVAILAAAGAHEILKRSGLSAGRIAHAVLLVFALAFAVQSASFQHAIVRSPSMILGGNGPVYAGARPTLDRDLAAALEEVETGEARRAAADAKTSALFESSSDVLFSYSGVTGAPALKPVGSMLLEPGPEGTRATVEVPPALVDVPEFAVRERGRIIVRLDMTIPIEGWMTLFFQTEAHREYKRTQQAGRRLVRGRNLCWLVIPAAGLRGSLRLWLGPTRCVIHSIEVRAVESES